MDVVDEPVAEPERLRTGGVGVVQVREVVPGLLCSTLPGMDLVREYGEVRMCSAGLTPRAPAAPTPRPLARPPATLPLPSSMATLATATVALQQPTSPTTIQQTPTTS